MKNLSILIALLIVTILSACSSTSKVVVEKKALFSDHYLMLSLLNRPMTQDQQMMLAFAQQSENYQSPYFVNMVTIKGPKSDSTANQVTTTRAQHSYSYLISQDFNSVQISGPN
tara:strand:- start:4896 stop:5237 length:342 start_codon:yes stop_codon:yes gene_type:complete